MFEKIHLRIMQVRPRGQKKPGQHGLHLSALTGTILSDELKLGSSVEQAQPDWQPGAHEFWLQFLLILPTRLLPKLLRYNSISSLSHSMLTICPAYTTNLFYYEDIYEIFSSQN
jgi:hypothetical protein